MKIDQRFAVARRPDEVWAFLQDVPAVASCLPGATLGEAKSADTWSGSVAVTLGPLSLTFEGEATIQTDEGARGGRVTGSGVDRRGGSRGRIEVEYRVVPEGSDSALELDADVILAGPAAQFGRTGIVEEISRRIVTDFASCLESRLTTRDPVAHVEGEPAPLRGGRLLMASMWASIRRLLRRVLGKGKW